MTGAFSMSDLQEFEEALRANVDSFNRASEKPLPKKRVQGLAMSVSPVTDPVSAPTKDNIAGEESKKVAKRWEPSEGITQHIITLRVQKKQIAPPELFTFLSPKLSRLVAENDARKAAKAAGYPVISFIEKWETP
jgi:hypothetical protein